MAGDPERPGAGALTARAAPAPLFVEGAEPVSDGRENAPPCGYFLSSSLLGRAPLKMRVYRKENFGPAPVVSAPQTTTSSAGGAGRRSAYAEHPASGQNLS